MYKLILLIFIICLTLSAETIQRYVAPVKTVEPVKINGKVTLDLPPKRTLSRDVMKVKKVYLRNPILISDILYYSTDHDGSQDDYVNLFSYNYDTFGSHRANGLVFQKKELTSIVDLKSSSNGYKGVVYNLENLSPLKRSIIDNHVKRMPYVIECNNHNEQVHVTLYLDHYQRSFTPISTDENKVKIMESINGYHFLLSECQ